MSARDGTLIPDSLLLIPDSLVVDSLKPESRKNETTTKTVLQYLRKEKGEPLKQAETDLCKKWCQQVEPEAVKYAIDLTAIYNGVLICSYIDAIIQAWVEAGVTTRAAAEQREQFRKRPPPPAVSEEEVDSAARYITVMLENDLYVDNPDPTEEELRAYLSKGCFDYTPPGKKRRVFKRLGFERFL